MEQQQQLHLEDYNMVEDIQIPKKQVKPNKKCCLAIAVFFYILGVILCMYFMSSFLTYPLNPLKGS